MVRRLENRIKEVVSEVLSRARIAADVASRQTVSRVDNVEVELPDLVVAEGSGGGEEAISLEDAIAKAVVVAMDEELENVFEGNKEKNGERK